MGHGVLQPHTLTPGARAFMPSHKEFQGCRGERLSPRFRTPGVGARFVSLLTYTLGPNMDPLLLGQASSPKSLGSRHESSP
ncbi:hypothetical protein NC652_012653 [Populus alba x Populus x berolinensis]|nr:hypothetical protein NC652_012653 [Populus alba x Populus x berolinensis]